MTEPKENETTNETIASEVWKQTFFDLATQHGIGAAAGYLDRLEDLHLVGGLPGTFSMVRDSHNLIIEHALWAAKQFFVKPVIRKVVALILDIMVTTRVEDRSHDHQLIAILDLLTQTRFHEYEFKLPGSVKKGIERFLKDVVRVYSPDDEDKAEAIVMAVHHHGMLDELNWRRFDEKPSWLGSNVVVKYLTGVVSPSVDVKAIPLYFTYNMEPRVELHQLLAHWTAAGMLTDKITELLFEGRGSE